MFLNRKLLCLWSLASSVTAGCAVTPPQVPTKDKVPEVLLLECPSPDINVGTNGDMASTLKKYIWALEGCNQDKAAVRDWNK